MHGVDVYRTYLAFKQHFSNPKFDFFQYDGKVKAKEETYQQRSDFWFYEVISKKYNDMEIKERFLSVFVQSPDPTKVWIGDIKNNGDKCWFEFQRRWGSMGYLFMEDLKHLKEVDSNFNNLLSTKDGHPRLLKEYMKGKVMLETILILDIVCGFQKNWDRELRDPLWEPLSQLIKNYKPFCSVNRDIYKEHILGVF